MKCKKLLKFYFFSDGLERAFNNLIYSRARSAFCGERSGEFYAEEILKLIEEKIKLGEIWNYLDGVIKKFKTEEISVLRRYGGLRGGVLKLDKGEQREIKRVVTKFCRRLKNTDRYLDSVEILKKYYCLLNTDLD